MLAGIFNVPVDRQTTDEWAFTHMAHHRDIARRIYEIFGYNMPLYSLDPLNPDDLGTFGYQHQNMHNIQNAILKISGSDLVDVDWKNEEERGVWIDLNAREHLAASNILGV